MMVRGQWVRAGVGGVGGVEMVQEVVLVEWWQLAESRTDSCLI